MSERQVRNKAKQRDAASFIASNTLRNYANNGTIPENKRTGTPASLQLSSLITARLPYLVPDNYRTGTRLIFLQDEGMFYHASPGNYEGGTCWYWDAVTPAYAVRELKQGAQLMNLPRKEELIFLTRYEKFDTGYQEKQIP